MFACEIEALGCLPSVPLCYQEAPQSKIGTPPMAFAGLVRFRIRFLRRRRVRFFRWQSPPDTPGVVRRRIECPLNVGQPFTSPTRITESE